MDAVNTSVEQDVDLAPYLRSYHYVNSDDPDIRRYAEDVTRNCASDIDKAIALFTAVRDDIRYDPYVDITDKSIYYASECLSSRWSFCIPKAALLVACARVAGIPARVAYSDVRNHLCTPRLRQLMRTDVFSYHGFSELYLNGCWVKATPTFNIELCRKFGVEALEFDGVNDALLHAFDREGRKHMEYVESRGSYPDVPTDKIIASFVAEYGEDIGVRLIDAGNFGAEASSSAST